MSESIPLARPEIGDAEREAVLRVLNSGRLSLGPALADFEARLAAAAGVEGAVGVNSGTSALQLMLEAAGIGPGDEVITTSLSFVATANAIRRVGALPVFADIDPVTRNLCPAAAERLIGERTRGILVVHLFGLLADMNAFRDLSRRRGVPLFEDACEALGSERDGLLAGAGGRAAVFGFYANKVITSGEGGAVVSDDEKLLARCRRLRNHGRANAGEAFADPVPGFNFRLSELHAALGAVQLARLDDILERRRRLARRYHELLAGIPGLTRPEAAQPGERISWFTYVVLLPDVPDVRPRVARHLSRAGIASGHYFPAIHTLPPYARGRNCRHGPLPATESVAARSLALPFYAGLSDGDMERIAVELRRAVSAAVTQAPD